MIETSTLNGWHLLTQGEAARMCRVTTLTLSKWFEKKKLPRIKIGREWRYHPDVIAALAKGEYRHDVPVTEPKPIMIPVGPVSTGSVASSGRVVHHRRGVYAVKESR